MAVYYVALVRFDGGSRTYPVNGAESYQQGQRVLVEMNWGRKSLAKAEVVGRSFCSKPCRHSIVCLEDRADDYGDGPAAVTTKAELDRFMRHMKLRPVPAFSCNYDGEEIKDQSWSVAYLPEFRLPFRDQDNLSFSPGVDVYLMGPVSIGICYADDEDVRLRRVGRRLGVVRASCRPYSPQPKNIFQETASLAFGELAHEKIPERIDRRMSEIRDALSGDGGGGPQYLGDGEWL